MTSPKVLLSGGGTGGHIFPAIAIAQEIQKRFPNAEFLFIGAENKMEMEKVPQAGYKIIGLNISGIERGSILANLKLPFKIISSIVKARKAIREFQPDFAIGTGGFASGPALWAASGLKIPTFVQEQNSFPGITNKLLGSRVKTVFTAYPDMAHFFPKTQVQFLGNPVREDIISTLVSASVAKEKLNLDKNKITILSVGGSLGSRTINNAWERCLSKIIEKDIQLIWQTGKTDFKDLKNRISSKTETPLIQIHEFISDMATAYSAADIIVSRAGAIAISELALAKKPVLLIPFPYAAEDHQTKNAMSLVNKNAAKMIKDSELEETFWNALTQLIENESLRSEISSNIAYFAKPNATKEIVDEVIKMINKP